ncbi:riboflavin synthase subunit alpha [Parendozoicomonas haliclonae]|uniref:Riboflavin synthase n=1 Tax=Parendozoicomonas haliclonae TaxID=1960125 RepID=A0A1X7ANG3_9GAMM|nr:riboflavin synthase subunit alpha [Parendozoicomonas haliclonae]SMA49861.1 Riboflavin synthase [Parendozoicomonas haliclonae]
MFTGIVQGTREVESVELKDGFATFTILLGHDLSLGLQVGASVAVNGVCLTVTQCTEDSAKFDVIDETLRVTNLSSIKAGTLVNVERAARFGDEIGGHSMSGHIHDTVEVSAVDKTPDNTKVTFRFDSRWQDYILPKGYIGLNGASLTIGAEVSDKEFCVHLIPETLRQTVFGHVRVGDRINMEIDPQTQAIVDTVKKVLEARNI